MNIQAFAIRNALTAFGGVGRRFETKGVSNGVTIIDDYGHHPVEISAALGGRMMCGKHKLIAVVQPHRYSRLADLFVDFCGCFHDADEVLVADVYAAGETPIEGINRDALVSGLRDHGHKADALLHRDELAGEIKARTSGGDLVMCLVPAITNWAANLPDELEKLGKNNDRPVVPFTAGARHLSAIKLAQHTWFGVGGPADILFSHLMRTTLPIFGRLSGRYSGDRDGRWVEPFGTRRRRVWRCGEDERTSYQHPS